MARGRLRLPLALLAAAAAAEGALALVRPRGGVVAPVPVAVESYFSAAELERARAFRRPQLALHGARLAIEATVLGALVLRPPALLRRPRRRPVLAGAAVAGALSAGLATVTLPLAAAARQRSLAAGLATQPWGGWAADVVKATAISAGLTGAGAGAVLALAGRWPDRWWAPAAALAVGAGAVGVTVAPVVLDPVFNRFDPLPDGPARQDVLALAAQAGVDVGEVYAVDASRRTSAANAYVTGLGATKRVVLYDTLLEHFTRDEVRLVVAHELAHVRHRDLLRGLLFGALVAPAAALAAQAVAERVQGGGVPPAPGPAQVPALAAGFALAATVAGPASNRLSRRVEARADTAALALTGAPEPFIAFERRIALRNLADPDPPRWLTALLATHPPVIERIGVGVAWQRGARPAR